MKPKNESSDEFSLESLSQWKEVGKQLMEEVSTALQDRTKSIREKSLDEISKDVTGYVKKNPLRSLFIAFGVGVLLRSLFRRSK